MKKISIIVPVYYNQDNLLPLYADLKEKVLSKINIEYELITFNFKGPKNIGILTKK